MTRRDEGDDHHHGLVAPHNEGYCQQRKVFYPWLCEHVCYLWSGETKVTTTIMDWLPRIMRDIVSSVRRFTCGYPHVCYLWSGETKVTTTIMDW